MIPSSSLIATRGYAHPEALVDIDWLEAHLYAPNLRILDGSFFLPGIGRNPEKEYARAHIPGADFFDIDGICDPTSTLPHMLPAPALFAERASTLGVDRETRVIVYDQPGSCAAPRVWWSFRCFGHTPVCVLDGGLAAWIARGLPTTDAPPHIAPACFRPCPDPTLVCSWRQVQDALADPAVQIVDCRPAGRYAGVDPEPRPALRRGHVPGARNLPFLSFLDTGRTGAWRPASELRALFADAALDPEGPLIAYCGSGVTACAAAFAAYLLGHYRVAVYDGSWAEWGNREDLPVQGPPE